MENKLRASIVGFLIISVGLISNQAYATIEPAGLKQALSQVENSVDHSSQGKLTPEQSMRDEAIERAAKIYGAQSARYYRWQQVENMLFQRNRLLSRVFNFGGMYLDRGLVQPPVLDMSSNVTHISNSGQVRELVDDVYRVLIPADFKQRAISWQSFLLPDSLSKPTFPRSALLPRNPQEKQLWQYYIRQGWPQGVQEANEEFSTRLASLNNAYQGMVLYTMLSMRGMVSPPKIVKSTRSVESAANGQQMSVGVHKQVISKKSYLVASPNHWKPVYYGHHFALIGGDN